MYLPLVVSYKSNCLHRFSVFILRTKLKKIFYLYIYIVDISRMKK